MGFDFLKFVTEMLGGLDVDEISMKAADWLKEKGLEYPDVKDRTDALAAYLTETLAEVGPELDPAKLVNTIKGIAADLVHGTAGVDYNSWTGSV